MSKAMLKIELKHEVDGRWLGEVPKLPGVMAYGATELEARKKTAALAFHVIAERIEHDEPVPINLCDWKRYFGEPHEQRGV